ncbi:hypothetical protein Snoj_26060 [Streptomyces nojiriensis]|uniref:Uncharacterized protein n=1 Tax=Streptomyces nojiriensis TaxID=66374 RepID=A0ABQ3SKM1_9ACTN|nr:hypothetical protein GCM10010205_69660 [Streptomyces nojiriensis]GHI68688.1 hypothetical protein Snoj_26060 [Streptomyces nojiriensis]
MLTSRHKGKAAELTATGRHIGNRELPVTWPELRESRAYEADVDLSGPIADDAAHLSVTRNAAVQLPAELTALLTNLVRRPDGLAAEEPVVALKALARQPLRPAGTTLVGPHALLVPAPARNNPRGSCITHHRGHQDAMNIRSPADLHLTVRGGVHRPMPHTPTKGDS